MGGGGSTGQSTSTQATGRALMTPDEVRRLSPTAVLAFAQGRPPAVLGRINYLTALELRGRFDANPMH